MEKNKKKKPTIPKRNINEELYWSWRKLYRRGDAEAIRKSTPFKRGTIDAAIKYGFVTTPGLTTAITEYFTTRSQSEKDGAEKLESLAK